MGIHKNDFINTQSADTQSTVVSSGLVAKLKSPLVIAILQFLIAIGLALVAIALLSTALKDLLFGIQLPLTELGISQFQSFFAMLPWLGLIVGVLAALGSLVLLRKAHGYYVFRYQGLGGEPRISFVAVLLFLATFLGSISLFTSVDNVIARQGVLGWAHPFENFFDQYVLDGSIILINEESVVVEDDDGNRFEISKDDLAVHEDEELSIGDQVAVVLPESKDDLKEGATPGEPIPVDVEKPIVVNPDIPDAPSEPDPPASPTPDPDPSPNPTPEPQPTGQAIPGRIEAESFSDYHDTSSGNTGDGTCRSGTNVDLKNAGGSNCIVGWFDGGEWLEYEVNIAQSGTYTLLARVAQGGSANTSFTIQLNGSNVATGVQVASTGSWDNLATIQHNNISLPSGSHTLRISRGDNWFDLDWFELSIQSGGGTPTPDPEPDPPSNPYDGILTFTPKNPDSIIFAQGFNSRSTGEYTNSEIAADFTQNGHNNTGVSIRGVQPRIENENGNHVFVKEFKSGTCCNSAHGTYFDTSLDKDYVELYLAYRVRTESNFNPVLGGKLPGFCGGDCNTGGSVPTGHDGWSARNMWRAGGDLIQYMYHPDQSGVWGSDWHYSSAKLKGSWQTIEHRVKMNTPGQSNGVMQAWVDGSLQLNRTNVRYRETSSLAIDQFIFSHFWGGNSSAWAPTQDENFYFDDFVISTDPITH